MVAGLALDFPRGLTLALLAVLPLGVALLGGRRQQQVALALRLEPTPLRRSLRPAVLPACVCLALALAAARPALTRTSTRSARTSSEVVFVTDISRSMLASAQAGSPTRLDRARSVIATLRADVPEVPAGLSGLTDRALPYVFPTLDRSVFDETLARSVQVDAPAPLDTATVATRFSALTTLVRDGFFTPGVENRTCVLVTDGETRSGTGNAAALATQRGCKLVVVRVGDARDRIYRADGTPEPGYRPEPSAATTVDRLARLAGGSSFTADQLQAAGKAVESAANVGDRRQVGAEKSSRSLAPLFAGLALLGVVLVVVRACFVPERRAYDSVSASHVGGP